MTCLTTVETSHYSPVKHQCKRMESNYVGVGVDGVEDADALDGVLVYLIGLEVLIPPLGKAPLQK